MRYLVGLFGNKDLAEEYKAKIKEIQDSGKVPNDIEFEYEGKNIKLYLPNDVREQYKLLLMAESFLIKDYLDDEMKILDLRMRLFDNAVKRILVDGHEGFNLNQFDVGIIDAIIMAFMDLLLPLYLRSSSKVEEKFKASLKKRTTVL